MRARVSQAVSDFAARGAAWLIGWADGAEVCAVAAARQSFNAEALAGLMPVGLSLVGVAGPDAQENDRALRDLARSGPRAASHFIAYTVSADGSRRSCTSCAKGASQNPSECQAALEEGAKILQSRALVRLDCRLQVLVRLNKDAPTAAELQAASEHETLELRKKTLVLYSEEGGTLYVPGSANGYKTCKEFLGGDREISSLHFMLEQPEAAVAAVHGLSLEPARLLTLDVQLDICGYLSKTAPIQEAHALLLEVLISQLGAMMKAQGTKPGVQPRAYHFKISPFGVLFTVIYIMKLDPAGLNGLSADEHQNEAYRRQLHEAFGLAMNRPLLRVCNALDAASVRPDSRLTSKHLINVHEGLPKAGVAGGTQYFVDGLYEYYHYLQDGMDDKGWGCAYRSLQTIISWFRLQNYSSRPIPTHREIQEVLVRVGDKPKNFVGSSQWIGAIDLSIFLDVYLGATCKILAVNSGAELAEKGRELANHFQTHGTPIMIGGGVLAYTLLGIEFNELTGDIRFLILDPHYTGPDDVGPIQSKGWCNWKGADLFLKTAFYNLCCPMRPQQI